MSIKSINTFVLQVNLVNSFDYIDKKGKIFSYLYKKIPDSTNRTLVNDEIKIGNKSIQYVINTNIFALRIINPDLKNIADIIKEHQEAFVKSVEEICEILGLEKINRFAYRLIAQYSIEDKDIKKILKNDSFYTSKTTSFQKQFSYKNLGLLLIYNNNNILEVDIDRFINSREYSVSETKDKYDKLIKDSLHNINDPYSLITNLVKNGEI